MMTDFDVMLQKYPQMILISKSPITWKGFLTATNNEENFQRKVKVKLVVPSFPTLDKASVLFGGSIAVLFGSKFEKQITSLLSKCDSVPNFLQELASLIAKLLGKRESKRVNSDLVKTDRIEKLLKELKIVLNEYSDIELSSTKDLSAVKLTMNDISMIVQPTVNSSSQYSWKIVSSDLPELPCSINDKKPCSLKEIRKEFQKQVDMLEAVWDQLRKIDRYCWVTDPLNPKPYHLYRRIYLSPSLSLFLTLNPLNPSGYPNIKFFGADSEVEKYKDKISERDFDWDEEYSVHENLLTVLDIDEFPQAPKNDEPMEENGMVGDEECCICFSLELDNGEVPDEVCENQKCRRRFHTSCLFQWLQELPENKITFNKLYGPCPNCGEVKSCNVRPNS